MGELETKGKKRKNKRDLKFALLAAVKVSALAGVVLLAPNIPQALYKLGLLSKESNDTTTIGRAYQRLIRNGLLKRTEKGLRLTDSGIRSLSMLEATFIQKKTPRWDGRWRVLIFDIPEHRKTTRDKMRQTLMHIGFVRLQDSVWIYPYDCEDFILMLKAEMRIGKDVLYMIVDELEGDSWIRKQFHLPASK